jgi:hypothetical protein
MSNITLDLKYLGYVNVCGMREVVSGAMIISVRQGEPLTWYWYNGVVVVYDEQGNPWIKKEPFKDFRFPNLKQRRVNVPFSNDPEGLARLFPPKGKGLLA